MVTGDVPAAHRAALRWDRADTGREFNYTPAFIFLQVLVDRKRKIFLKKILEKNPQEDDIDSSS